MLWELHSGYLLLFFASNLRNIFIVSQKKTTELVDKVNEAHAWKVEEMQQKVELMLATSVTNREKSACATAGAMGFCMFGDNVGKVINPR